MNRAFSILMASVACCYWVVPARAQDGAKEKFAAAQKQNAALLRQYGWQSRTELKLKGESKNVKVESVRYDPNGQLQKTTLQSTPQAQEPSGGRLKRKVVEKKKEEYGEILQGIGQLAQNYAHMSPDQMQKFAQGASISQGQGTVEIHGSNVVVTGDSVIVSVDPATFLIKQVKVDSLYENNPVHLDVSFQVLPQGPSYPAQVDLAYPKKEIQVQVLNSNYQRLVAAAGPGPAPAAPAPPRQVAAAPAAAAAQPSDPGWPRQRVQDGTTLVTYQPQVDDWKDFKDITGRLAFSITPKGGKQVVGAITLEAQTDVDTDSHMVVLHDLKVLHTDFPSLDPDTTAKMDQLVRTFLPPTYEISLERLIALTPKKSAAQGVQLKNDPPDIFVSYSPAILVDVDGEPVSVSIANTNLEYVMNTTWRLFFDRSSSHYYLLAGEQWLTAANLVGPWSAASMLPNDMQAAASDDHFADLKNFVPMPAPKPGAVVPAVFYSTKPSEVVLFNGTPAFTPIPGTQLSYANNTVSYVFSYAPTKQVYYLTAGRWFSANSLDGPWKFATPNLPRDFAQIPPSSPAAQVLASVPGTEDAKDAVLMAQIPTTAVVDPAAAAADAKASYDGEPKFAPIEGTPMQYATNTANKVIRIGDVYYMCLNGVWFLSTTPQGPWQTAPSVPQEIYTIPPSSPVYNVTYVTQVTTSSGQVEASYTAGYMGAFVMGAAVGAVIAGGTGYYYPPYVGVGVVGFGGYPAYYPTPYTYGAAAYHNSATGAYGVSQTAYGAYGSATRTASYNPYTGTAARTASVNTPYGSAAAGRAYNPYTGASAASVQGSNAYGSWGSSAVSKNGQTAYGQHTTTAAGTTGSIQTSAGGKAVGSSTANGNTVAGKTSNGDMYAGHDGNVYKNTGSGWQKYNNSSGSWNSVQKPTQGSAQQAASGQRAGSPQSGSFSQQNLQNEAQNRQRGEQSANNFQQRSGGSGGGGRSYGGGGRRR